MRLILVRHGESLWNLEHRYQGQSDSGLTALGRRQAEECAEWLVGRYTAIDVVIASDLPRAYDTARPLARALGCEIHADQRLRELDVGTWAGRRVEEVAQEFPREHEAVRAGRLVRYGGGETYDDLRARVCQALIDPADLLREALVPGAGLSGGTIAVFTHGGPIRVATACAVGVPSAGRLALAHLGNVSVTELSGDAPGAPLRLVAYNLPTARRAVGHGA